MNQKFIFGFYISRTEADQLLVINKHLKNIVIGNITYCKEPLKLGDLKGNKFGVVIR